MLLILSDWDSRYNNFWKVYSKPSSMMKKSTLSIRSRAFVVSNKNNVQPSKKDRKSCDNIAETAENSMVICNYSIKNAAKKYLTTSSNCSDEEWISDASWKSVSTNESLRVSDSMHFGVESSDDSGSSRVNGVVLHDHFYNILDQKPPIRNVKSHTCESNADQTTPMSAVVENNNDDTTCDASQPEKKKTRRAGRKHKAQNKQAFEDGSNTDKEQVKYKTELCKTGSRRASAATAWGADLHMDFTSLSSLNPNGKSKTTSQNLELCSKSNLTSVCIKNKTILHKNDTILHKNKNYRQLFFNIIIFII